MNLKAHKYDHLLFIIQTTIRQSKMTVQHNLHFT